MRGAALALLGRLSLIPPPTAPRRHPVIVIVGPPRSGTTLLYQLLARHLRCTYLTNLQAAVSGAPWLLEPVLQRLQPWRRVDLRSRFGVTDGWWGPHEGARFWSRFFRDEPILEPAVADRLARELRAWMRFANAPLVVKNVVHSLRMEVLAAALPEARFVAVERDPRQVARSLLRAREAIHGRTDAWFSVEPPGWESLARREPAVQVVEQIAAVERAIAGARRALGPRRVLRVGYADLCRDPASVLAGLVRRLVAAPQLRGPPPPPQPYRDRPLSATEEAALDRAFAASEGSDAAH